MAEREDITTRRGFLRGALFAGAAVGVAVPEVAKAVTDEVTAPEPALPAPSAAPAGSEPLSFSLDGVQVSTAVLANDCAAEVLRDTFGATSCKVACGHGACGACTVMVDGKPRVTCIMPATSLQGRSIGTAAAIASLHPIARAFAAEDALQCGYCTPGFVVEATAFHDRWRAENGAAEPTKDQVSDALSGHLCRCGAYAAIHRAVAKACAGFYDVDRGPPARVEAAEKIHGRARYTVDVRLEGQLEAKMLTSVRAHARLVSIDTSKATAIDGVRAVLTILQPGSIARFSGQPVAAVAAVDRHVAAAAVAAIECEWEPLGAVFTMDEAMVEGAPDVYQGYSKTRDVELHYEGLNLPERWKGNLRGPLRLDFGSGPHGAKKAIQLAREAGRCVDLEIETPTQVHTALEPHCCVAHWTEAERLVVYASTQAVSDLAADVAEHYELDRANVHVIAQHIGGAFGAKALIGPEHTIAIDLAKAANAPVRLVWDRREEMTLGGYRPAFRIQGSLAWNEDGTLEALGCEAWGHGGVSVGSTIGLLFKLMYPHTNQHLEDWDVLTNLPPGKPFRGPGGPQSMLALEMLVDEAARRMGRDPIEVRIDWDQGPIRPPLLRYIASLPEYMDRAEHDTGRFRRGYGVAAGVWFNLYNVDTTVRLEAPGDGRVIAITGGQDMGNGLRSAIRAGVARELDLDPQQIEVRIGSSEFPYAVAASGSRSTPSVVGAAVRACARLKEELEDRARVNGISWKDALSAGGPEIQVTERRRGDPRSAAIPEAQGNMLARRLPGSAQLAEIEVDMRLGKVRMLRSWLAMGVGKIVAPTIARSQCEGAVIQGTSYALYEERRECHETGRIVTANLEDYRIMGIGDVPEIHVHFEEGGFPDALLGGVGLSELSGITTAAAICNAVTAVTGERPKILPIRPGRLSTDLYV